MENLLDGKNILLISNTGYAKELLEEFSCNGATGYFIQDKPSEGFFHKFLGRIHFKPYVKGILDKYYYEKIKKLDNQEIDYVLCIRGEYTSKEVLKRIRERHPEAKMVLYMWDSLRNNSRVIETWDSYDSVLTFDRKDYLQYKGKIGFLPLFYCESRLPKEKYEQKYDISFVGTGHQDRVKIVKQVQKQCEKLGLSFYSYIYSPHIMVFLYNKITNRHYRNVHVHDVRFKRISLAEVYKIYTQSNVILDIESSSQTGLTMRTIENIGTHKKLMTSNSDIVNYDFFDENNVLVFDRNNIVFDRSFFKRKYKELPEEIYEKYSLRQWVVNVLQ